MSGKTWDFFVDTGGTFTDCLARSDQGVFHRVKVLSRGSLSAEIGYVSGCNQFALCSNPNWPKGFIEGMAIQISGSLSLNAHIISWDPHSLVLKLDQDLPVSLEPGTTFQINTPWEAPILGMKLILARQGISIKEVSIRMRLATTRCTNALLEQTGESPVLFVTSGFADLLEIGDQRRMNLFDLIPQKRKTLTNEVVEVDERLDQDGEVLVSPDLSRVRKQAQQALENGSKTAAVSLLHSYLNPEHEKQVAEVLRESGFDVVIESSKLHPFIKWLPRCESAVVEAYLYIILYEYLNRVESELGTNGTLLVNTSAGGLIDRAQYRAIDSLLSGPAAGVVGASSIAKSCGQRDSINLDMGGTSTDVSRCSGTFAYQANHRVGDAHVTNLAMKLETVAAGGGSVCHEENGLLGVGPASAGAYPGPACYGFGGPFCLTDVNLLLGRLDSSRFATPVVLADAEQRLQEMIHKTGKSKKDLLEGFVSLANDSMANAIRKISIEEGYDPSNHALVAFGGAGGQHACGVATKLGMSTILSPADSGLLSAYGLLCSKVERIITRSIMAPVCAKFIKGLEQEMVEEGVNSIAKVGERGRVYEKIALVRFYGQDSTLEIIYQDPAEIEQAFRLKFTHIFGYFPSGKTVELHSLRLRLVGSSKSRGVESFGRDRISVSPLSHDSRYVRGSLRAGSVIEGPCLVVDDFGTLWVEEGWEAQVGDLGTLRLNRMQALPPAHKLGSVRRELFSSKFQCLADEMGSQLERTSLSVNIRERYDFSCALLDDQGYLVANAPHIPVHLGAMGLFTRCLLKKFTSLSKGDILVSNHPAFGGSHLPDVSLLAPVFGVSGAPVCYVANRAHHAEIGGISPGSMPAGAKSLAEEGIVIVPQFLFQEGKDQIDRIIGLLQEGLYPSRQLAENRADLSAQVASLRHGVNALEALLSTFGEDEILFQMKSLREESKASCVEYLQKWGSQQLVGEEFLDDGNILKLKVTITHGQATFDFSGTSPVRQDNLNATEAIVYSVVCYCLRVLINSELPLNEGLLDPIKIIVPSGTLLNPGFVSDPRQYPGVAGGNVEISQRLVDLILSSVFEVSACSQGTMNNLTFGNQSFSHYETICGGSGAKIGQEGTSAVQVHMTNTAITDPEILESRFPVRLLISRIRQESGGSGSWSGGNGVEREYLFKENTQFSLLTQRRVAGAQGLHGGQDGETGKQVVIRSTGEREILGSFYSGLAKKGDRLLIQTPGGGGVGEQDLLT